MTEMTTDELKGSELEAQFLAQVRAAGLPEPERQYQFHETREWKLDFAWPGEARMIAVEIHGGVFSGGRHTRGVGFTNDRQKMNAAQADGWFVFEFTAGMLDANEAIPLLKDLFELLDEVDEGEA